MSDYLTGPLDVFVVARQRGYDLGSSIQGVVPRLTVIPLLNNPQQPYFKRNLVADFQDLLLVLTNPKRGYVFSPALATVSGPVRPTEGQIWPR